MAVFSGKVAVNSPEHYCITCDKSLTAFLVALQLQEKLQFIGVPELSWKLRIVCVINCVYQGLECTDVLTVL